MTLIPIPASASLTHRSSTKISKSMLLLLHAYLENSVYKFIHFILLNFNNYTFLYNTMKFVSIDFNFPLNMCLELVLVFPVHLLN